MTIDPTDPTRPGLCPRAAHFSAPPPPRWRRRCVHPGRDAAAPSRADVPAARAAGMPAPDVETLLAQMTLDEKIGQMTQIDKNALETGREVHDLMVGSVLSGADSLPHPNAADTWVDMYDGYQSQALSTRLGIPMIYGVDAVHGHGGLKGATIFPHHIGLGCTRSPELVQAAARVTAREVAGTGIDWTFAPCIAVPRDERWGRTYEGYGEIARAGREPGRGGGARLSRRRRRRATASTSTPRASWPAPSTSWPTAARSAARIAATPRSPRRSCAASTCPATSPRSRPASPRSWCRTAAGTAQPMHGNRHLITDVLKGELGFTGFVVSDWAAIDKMSPDYTQDIETLDQRRHRHDDGADAGRSLPRVPATS